MTAEELAHLIRNEIIASSAPYWALDGDLKGATADDVRREVSPVLYAVIRACTDVLGDGFLKYSAPGGNRPVRNLRSRPRRRPMAPPPELAVEPEVALAAELEKLRDELTFVRSVLVLHQQDGCGVALSRIGEALGGDRPPYPSEVERLRAAIRDALDLLDGFDPDNWSGIMVLVDALTPAGIWGLEGSPAVVVCASCGIQRWRGPGPCAACSKGDR